jgi:phosphate acetyltransferase
MNSIINNIKKRASAKDATIIFPETEDPRVLEATCLLKEGGICNILLIGERSEITTRLKDHDINLEISDDQVQIISPQDTALREKAIERLLDRRKHKGMVREEAEHLVDQPLWFGALLLGMGYADGCVAGSMATTADVIRSGIYSLGLAKGVNTVSSTFLMAFDDGRTFTYADCGVVPYPDVGQLADITISANRTHEILTEQQGKVAMLSFSTKGSADHPRVELVRDALMKVQQRSPEMNIDGELQFDAAYVSEVAQRKAPESKVAGKANVFIFPNLDAGNIAYKITERLAGAQATGPILQGLAKPLMDLSRGCNPEDIVVAACVSILMG